MPWLIAELHLLAGLASAHATTVRTVSASAVMVVNPAIMEKIPYEPFNDFVLIGPVFRNPLIIVANDTVPFKNVKELVAYAKANPAKLNYGSGGNGSAGHLAGELFKKQAGIFALHIPYNGGNPAQLALLSGQVDFNFDNLATADIVVGGVLLPGAKAPKLVRREDLKIMKKGSVIVDVAVDAGAQRRSADNTIEILLNVLLTRERPFDQRPAPPTAGR